MIQVTSLGTLENGMFIAVSSRFAPHLSNHFHVGFYLTFIYMRASGLHVVDAIVDWLASTQSSALG